MHEADRADKSAPHKRNPLPIAAPAHQKDPGPGKGLPDLHIEEIEERHIPKDRNIFDK